MIRIGLSLFKEELTNVYYNETFDPVICASGVNRLLGLDPDSAEIKQVTAELASFPFDGAVGIKRDSIMFCHSPVFGGFTTMLFTAARQYLDRIQNKPGQYFYLKVTPK